MNVSKHRGKQGWAQSSFVEAEAEVKAERSRPRRGRVKSTLFAKRSFYRAANAIFGKIGRLASEEVILQSVA